ncbi:DUF418 domain-containing protein [Maribacter antarcticus]|uniref:DUF418 domain-containing protein n=1 Tax=Maribacter antarcticus TaxID=505250 RepID=UPI00047C85D4|nr:heparan-alpha-glucosaminide N-acetyltransferase domain-containing protein [Maribacter antarcticus]
MFESKQRIQGYDVASALALFIMVIVNFDLGLARLNDDGLLSKVLDQLQGKGAALFIVLAGVGISLLVKTNLFYYDKIKLWEKQRIVLKQGAFLFVLGLMYLPLWPTDILHYYGFFISIGALLISIRSKSLWILVVILIAVYPLILSYVDLGTGWNWNIKQYNSFWTFNGFLQNLLVNSFYPVVPWVAFVLAGIWLGRQNITNKNNRNLILLLSITIFFLVQMSSFRLGYIALHYTNMPAEDILAIWGTESFPPMPLFMISGISWSFTIILLCVWITEKMNTRDGLSILAKTGQMVFTHYILHVVVGILGVYLLFGKNNLSTEVAFLYAIDFCIVSIIFSMLWSLRFTKGPISMLMGLISKSKITKTGYNENDKKL